MNKDTGKTTPKKNKECDEKPIDSPAAEECKQNLKVHPISLPQIPPLLPLLHSEMQEACMLLCLQLLGLKSRKGLIDTTYLERMCPPPVILNGVFSHPDSRMYSVLFSFHTHIYPFYSNLQSSFVACATATSLSSSFISVLANGGS